MVKRKGGRKEGKEGGKGGEIGEKRMLVANNRGVFLGGLRTGF